MTQLLISVKNVKETLIALDAGVDIIDLKDPDNGALGALDVDTSAIKVSSTFFTLMSNWVMPDSFQPVQHKNFQSPL